MQIITLKIPLGSIPIEAKLQWERLQKLTVGATVWFVYSCTFGEKCAADLEKEEPCAPPAGSLWSTGRHFLTAEHARTGPSWCLTWSVAAGDIRDRWQPSSSPRVYRPLPMGRWKKKAGRASGFEMYRGLRQQNGINHRTLLKGTMTQWTMQQ